MGNCGKYWSLGDCGRSQLLCCPLNRSFLIHPKELGVREEWHCLLSLDFSGQSNVQKSSHGLNKRTTLTCTAADVTALPQPCTSEESGLRCQLIKPHLEMRPSWAAPKICPLKCQTQSGTWSVGCRVIPDVSQPHPFCSRGCGESSETALKVTARYRIIIDNPDCILSLFLLEWCHYQGIFALILKGWVEYVKNRKSSL